MKSLKSDFKGALQDYAQAIRLETQNGQLYHSRAYCLAMEGEVKGALADCDKAVDLGVKDPQLLLRRGLLHFALNNAGDAEKDIRAAIKLDPKLPFGRFCLWYIQMRGVQKEKAELEMGKFHEEIAASVVAGGDPWEVALSGFLAGKRSEDSVLSVAGEGPDEQSREDRKYQVRFFTGLKCLAQGERKAAAGHFQSCARTRLEGLEEYWRLAERELHSLQP